MFTGKLVFRLATAFVACMLAIALLVGCEDPSSPQTSGQAIPTPAWVLVASLSGANGSWMIYTTDHGQVDRSITVGIGAIPSLGASCNDSPMTNGAVINTNAGWFGPPIQCTFSGGVLNVYAQSGAWQVTKLSK